MFFTIFGVGLNNSITILKIELLVKLGNPENYVAVRKQTNSWGVSFLFSPALMPSGLVLDDNLSLQWNTMKIKIC